MVSKGHEFVPLRNHNERYEIPFSKNLQIAELIVSGIMCINHRKIITSQNILESLSDILSFSTKEAGQST